MEIKLPTTLQGLSTIAVADSLWNKEEIVSKVKAFFLSPTCYAKFYMWDSIKEEVIDFICPESLPDILYTDVVIAADILGRKKRDWFRFCEKRNIFRGMPKEELYENYLKQIYWTHYGTVDVEKIIRSWFRNPNCDLWKVYVMASCFCSEEVIMEIWTKVKKIYNPADFKKLYKGYGWHMAAYWDRYFSNNLDNFIADVKANFWKPRFYNELRSVEENMFRLCAIRGYKVAAKRFWLRLQSNEKSDVLIWCLEAKFEPFKFKDYDYETVNYFLNDNFIEIYFYIFNDFNSIGKEGLSERLFDGCLILVQRYMVCWPWIKLLVPYVNYRQDCFSERSFYELISSVLQRENGIRGSIDNIFQRTIFQLWKILPGKYKKNICRHIVGPLFYSEDVVNLKRILNDKDLIEFRNELIAFGLSKFRMLIGKENEEMIKNFIKLLIPTKWENHIQLKMEKIYEHIMNCELDSADDIFNTFCHSEDEVNSFKNEINLEFMGFYFVEKNQLESADEVLHWTLKSEEAVCSFKLSFMNEYFLNSHTLSFWDKNIENVEEAKLQSNKFLKWVFKSEKLIDDFFKNLRGKIRFFLSYWLLRRNRCKIEDDLMEWCSMDEVQKTHLKNRLKDLQSSYPCRNYSTLRLEDLGEAAQEILKWPFNSEEERGKFIRRFGEWKNFSANCKLFLLEPCGSSNMFEPNPSKEEISETIKEFIKFWIKHMEKETRDKLKKDLIEWRENWLEIMEKEQKVKENSDSGDEYGEENNNYYARDKCKHMYCDESNLQIFMELLQLFEENGDEFPN